ncbi:MAG: SDR family oxidoreductase [Verrucomicrobia subdivision 3 bacterium]|nr:SDR family oxidoreductase [Limisphaerales bacterium]
MPLAWITGAGGLIGNYLVRTGGKHASGWTIAALTREKLDITDRSAVEKMFRAAKPQLVIHCAAISKSVVCEQNPSLARQINVEATRHLSELAADAHFIFFSTDLVFDGRAGNYVEASAVNPLTIYGQTKVEAEQIVLRNPMHVVIRSSLNAGISPTGDRGFNEGMHRAWESGKTLTLFTDEFRCPIHAAVTARAVWELALGGRMGLYHLAGAERLSRLQIGEVLARRWPDVEARIEAASLKDYSGPPRSPDTSLNCARVQALLSFPLPAFTQWLRDNPHEPT